MEHSTILTEYNNRQYFLKLAKQFSREHDIIRLSKEIGQLEFQATQFLAQ